MKDGKVTGIVGIPVVLLKNLGEYIHKLLYDTITKRSETGDISQEFVKSRTITVPKKGT